MVRIKKDNSNHVVIIDQNFARDSSLTWKARGIFVYLWSQSEEWDFNEVEVTRHAADGRDSLRAGLKELEEHGYLERERERDKLGRVHSTRWILHENPVLENPIQDKPVQGNGTQRSHQEKISSKEDHINLNDDDQPVEDAFNLAQLAGINVNSGLNLPVFTDYINRLGNELVCYAIKRTNDVAQHPSWSYLKTVLKSLEDNRVKTVEQAEKLSKKYGQSRRGKSSPKKAGKKQQYHFETRKVPDGVSQTEAIAKELAEAEAEDRAKEAKRDDG